jgi:hypothetical protein
MLGHREFLKLLVGAVLLATFVFALMSAPGFLSDIDSMLPGRGQGLEAAQ